jgi:hypothetical protein
MIIRKSTSKNTQEKRAAEKNKGEKHLFAFQLTKSIKLDILNVCFKLLFVKTHQFSKHPLY